MKKILGYLIAFKNNEWHKREYYTLGSTYRSYHELLTILFR